MYDSETQSRYKFILISFEEKETHAIYKFILNFY